MSGRRQEIWAEVGRTAAEMFVPQTHQPGAEAEVDFAELYVDLPVGRTKCYLFTLRLCFSGRSVHRVFVTQSQEAFLEGHIAAFTELGGCPTVHIKPDSWYNQDRLMHRLDRRPPAEHEADYHTQMSEGRPVAHT